MSRPPGPQRFCKTIVLKLIFLDIFSIKHLPREIMTLSTIQCLITLRFFYLWSLAVLFYAHVSRIALI